MAAVLHLLLPDPLFGFRHCRCSCPNERDGNDYDADCYFIVWRHRKVSMTSNQTDLSLKMKKKKSIWSTRTEVSFAGHLKLGVSKCCWKVLTFWSRAARGPRSVCFILWKVTADSHCVSTNWASFQEGNESQNQLIKKEKIGSHIENYLVCNRGIVETLNLLLLVAQNKPQYNR